MKKRFLCAVISVCMVCLNGVGLAESIRARMAVPDAVQAAFVSPSGKTVVTISAVPEVPQVDTVPVIEAVQALVPPERAVALANLLMGEGQWTGDTDYPAPQPLTYVGLSGPIFEGLTEANMELTSLVTNINGYPAQHLSVFSKYQHGDVRGLECLDYSSWFQGMSFGYNWTPLHGLKGRDARGCRYAREEAAALAREVQQTLAPELTEMVCGLISNEPETVQDAYVFYFTREVAGIPVTYSIENCGRIDEDSNGEAVYYRQNIFYETLRVLVTDNGVEEVRYENPMALLEPASPDCELLSFAQVMNVAEVILPLKYTHLEGYYDEVRLNVDRVTFGYMRVYDAGEMYRWHLIPVWDFFGTYDLIRDGQVIVSHDEDLSSLLTVNASTGLIIDRNYGY